MKKAWDFTKGLLVDGYAICVAAISQHPHAAFWVIAALLARALI